MRVLVLAVSVLSSVLISATPVVDANSWEARVQNEVAAILASHDVLHSVSGEQMDLQVAAQSEWSVPSSLPTGQERPRPPALQGSISNLRSLMDHIELENVNSVANQDAVSASYSSKRALIESMIANPQQAIIARSEQRQMCSNEVNALTELDGVVGKAIERAQSIADMRSQQASTYTDMTNSVKSLTQKNIETLNRVTLLINDEIKEEMKLDSGQQFDPVSLRQQPPEDMLRHANSLTGNLLALMKEKMANQEAALGKINAAFACPECVEAEEKLQGSASIVRADLVAARERCAVMIEAHRALDEADRNKVISLKKDLDDIESAERVHKAAEASLAEQRKMSQHVASKMVGFYGSLAPKSGGVVA